VRIVGLVRLISLPVKELIASTMTHISKNIITAVQEWVMHRSRWRRKETPNNFFVPLFDSIQQERPTTASPPTRQRHPATPTTTVSYYRRHPPSIHPSISSDALRRDGHSLANL
jgi:hypothetical protein